MYVFGIYILFVVIERIGMLLFAKMCPRSRPYFVKLNRFLFWNGINTLAMEVYLDVGIAACVNVVTMRWPDNNPDLAFSNYFAIVCLIFIIGYPIWLILFFCFKEPNWQEEDFTSRFGSILAETRLENREHKWLPLVLPIIFLLRRAIFIFSVVVVPEFLWL